MSSPTRYSPSPEKVVAGPGFLVFLGFAVTVSVSVTVGAGSASAVSVTVTVGRGEGPVAAAAALPSSAALPLAPRPTPISRETRATPPYFSHRLRSPPGRPGPVGAPRPKGPALCGGWSGGGGGRWEVMAYAVQRWVRRGVRGCREGRGPGSVAADLAAGLRRRVEDRLGDPAAGVLDATAEVQASRG